MRKLQKHRERLLAGLVLGALLFQPLFVGAQTVDLVTDIKFNPNDIISDEDVTDLSMTSDEIQTMLGNAGGKLARYSEPSPPTGELRTAAQIIWQAAQDARINPEIILAMLQKEQSLLEDLSPSQYQLDWAVGYSKCDGCAGVSAYKGFGNQVRAAATRIRYYLDHPGEFEYKVGKASTTKDGFLVAPQNQATANLYIYNPYRGGTKLNDRFIGANFNFYKVWNKFFAPKVAVGAVVRERESNGYYLIGETERKPFIAPEVVSALYSADERDRAPVLPRRKLSRFYPLLGQAITLADVYAAALYNSDIPPLWAGSDGELVFTYKNLGSKSWARGDVVIMMTDAAGSPYPEAHEAWIEPTVAVSFKEESVKPGELATFRFPIFSSTPYGTEVILKLMGRADNAQADHRGYTITVSGSSSSRIVRFESPYQAFVEALKVPEELTTGLAQKVTLAVKNTGNISWEKMNIRLSTFDNTDPGGSVVDYLNPKPRIEKVKKGKKTIVRTLPPLPAPAESVLKHPSWRDAYRIALMNEKEVNPGELATFEFSIRTPTKPQNVTSQLRLEFVELKKPNAEHRIALNGNSNYEWKALVKRPAPRKKSVKSKTRVR